VNGFLLQYFYLPYEDDFAPTKVDFRPFLEEIRDVLSRVSQVRDHRCQDSRYRYIADTLEYVWSHKLS
jgi:hypothetical protein